MTQDNNEADARPFDAVLEPIAGGTEGCDQVVSFLSEQCSDHPECEFKARIEDIQGTLLFSVYCVVGESELCVMRAPLDMSSAQFGRPKNGDIEHTLGTILEAVQRTLHCENPIELLASDPDLPEELRWLVDRGTELEKKLVSFPKSRDAARTYSTITFDTNGIADIASARAAVRAHLEGAHQENDSVTSLRWVSSQKTDGGEANILLRELSVTNPQTFYEVIRLFMETTIPANSKESILASLRCLPFLRNGDIAWAEGMLLSKQQKYAEARECYERALEDSSFPGIVHNCIAVDLIETKHYEDAISQCREAHEEHHPEPWKVFANWGTALNAMKRHEEAAAMFERSIEQGNTMPAIALCRWGSGLMELGRVEEAEEKFEQALNAGYPDPWWVLNCWGYALYEAKKYEEALLKFEEMIAVGCPDRGLALHNIGWMLFKLGRYEEAIGKYQEALHAGFLKKWSVLTNWAGALQDLQRYEDAIEKYEEAIAAGSPKPSDIQCNIASCLQNLGRNEEALATYEQALESDPKDSVILYNYANTLYKIGRYEEAALKLEQSLKAGHPEPCKAFLNLGSTLYNLGKYEAAILKYEDALEAGHPKPWEALWGIGNALRKLRKDEQAIAKYEEAIEAGHPEPWILLVFIGQMYEDQGDIPRAYDCFTQAWEQSHKQYQDALDGMLRTSGKTGDDL